MEKAKDRRRMWGGAGGGYMEYVQIMADDTDPEHENMKLGQKAKLKENGARKNINRRLGHCLSGYGYTPLWQLRQSIIQHQFSCCSAVGPQQSLRQTILPPIKKTSLPKTVGRSVFIPLLPPTADRGIEAVTGRSAGKSQRR